MKLREELELPINFSGNWIPKEFYYIDGLNGSDRELLSMILHLNIDGKGCTASNKYLSNILGVSERQVINSINKLDKLLLIEKTLTNNTYRRLKLSSYLLSPIQEEVAKIEAKTKENNRGEESFIGGMKKTSQVGEENFMGGMKETSYNNKDNNKDNNKKEKKETEYDIAINSYTDNAELKEAIYDFIKMRKMIKKPATTRALKTMLNKLDNLSIKTDEYKIAVINESIEHNWLSVFEIKGYKSNIIKGNSISTGYTKRNSPIPDFD